MQFEVEELAPGRNKPITLCSALFVAYDAGRFLALHIQERKQLSTSLCAPSYTASMSQLGHASSTATALWKWKGWSRMCAAASRPRWVASRSSLPPSTSAALRCTCGNTGCSRWCMLFPHLSRWACGWRQGPSAPASPAPNPRNDDYVAPNWGNLRRFGVSFRCSSSVGGVATLMVL